MIHFTINIHQLWRRTGDFSSHVNLSKDVLMRHQASVG